MGILKNGQNPTYNIWLMHLRCRKKSTSMNDQWTTNYLHHKWIHQATNHWRGVGRLVTDKQTATRSSLTCSYFPPCGSPHVAAVEEIVFHSMHSKCMTIDTELFPTLQLSSYITRLLSMSCPHHHLLLCLVAVTTVNQHYHHLWLWAECDRYLYHICQMIKTTSLSSVRRSVGR